MRLTVTNSYSQAGAVSQFTPNLHDHSFSEVFVCIKGTVNINLTNNIITLNENDAVIIPPWLYHVKQTTSSNTIDRVLSFSIIKNSNKNCFDIHKQLKVFISGDSPIICRNCPDFCKTVNKIFERHKSETEYIAAIDFTRALLELSLSVSKSNIINSTDTNKRIFTDVQRMALIDDLIGRYYKSKINANDFAEMLFISRRQLDRIIKERFGRPLYSVIIERRVNTAASLLLNTNLKIEQIALSVGFNSSNSLYKAFDKHFCCTPNEYRQKTKKGKD